jgi:hypothetical protein
MICARYSQRDRLTSGSKYSAIWLTRQGAAGPGAVTGRSSCPCSDTPAAGSPPELIEEIHQASGNLPFAKPEQAFTLLVSGIITPDIAQHMLMAVLHGLGHLFGLGGQHVHGTLNR